MADKNADRQLLFGILALQTGFISREDLVAATAVWLEDKSRPLDEIFVERKILGRDEHALLTGLVQKHLELYDDDPQKSLAAVSSIGSSVRRDLTRLADRDIEATLDHVGTARDDRDAESTISYLVGRTPEDGERFRILRPHARGGLGEVFVAVDNELNREVALKEIQVQLADNPDNRARFLLEAEITGRLEHPGIVPVYGLGHYADGRPFYAMRFIKGNNLRRAIDRFHRGAHADDEEDVAPLPKSAFASVRFRKLMGRFIDVCNAIEYAHSRGILHRDLKPGNIMLGKHGTTLVVDWGLAKSVGRSEQYQDSTEVTIQPVSGSGSAPTRLGSAVGTPAYMSPEQAAGKLDEMGPASDVYGLGATLYCLLAGRSPVEEDEPGKMLQRVEEGDFPAPRRLNVNIPRPLEAICLKAMALRPKDRYQSPRQLADDLEKYLADEPVSAYQESALESAGRWMRKHRQRVLLGTALTFGLGALIIAALLVDRANRISRHEAELRTEELRTSLTTADSLAAQRIESGDFPGAVKLLDRALAQLGDRPGFDRLQAQLAARRERTDRLATFHQLQRQLYAHQFSEEFDEAEAAAHACLKTLGITQDSSKWWQELPSDDLREPQAAELRDDVHGVILFLLYRSIQRGLFEFVWQNGDAENAYRSTPEVKRRMAEAQRYLKLANAYRESASTQYFGLVIRFALGDISPIAFLHQWITLKPREPAGAVDCFYTGVFYDITNVTILPNYAVFIQAARLLGSKTRLPDAGEEAERMYIEALLRRPDYFPACYKLADLLARKGDYAASVQTYNTCIQLQPDLALLYAGRGAALLARSHTVQDQTVSVRLEQLGQADLKYALKLSPDGAATLMKVGLTEARFGDLDAGCRRMLTGFDRMLPTRLSALGTTSFVPLRPQDDQFLRELESLSQRGAAPEQVAVLEAAFLASLDKWERVWDTLPKLSADHPWQPIALALRAEAALQLAGNDSNWQQVREGLTAEEVLSWSRDSFQGRPAHRPLRTAVQLLLRVNRPDEAFALLEQAEDDKASTAPWQQFELLHLKSRTLAALGRAADSHDLAEQARALNPLWFERAERAGDR